MTKEAETMEFVINTRWRTTCLTQFWLTLLHQSLIHFRGRLTRGGGAIGGFTVPNPGLSKQAGGKQRINTAPRRSEYISLFWHQSVPIRPRLLADREQNNRLIFGFLLLRQFMKREWIGMLQPSLHTYLYSLGSEAMGRKQHGWRQMTSQAIGPSVRVITRVVIL